MEHEGLPPPPQAALAATTPSLPAEGLVGREGELAAAETALAQRGVVAIGGVAGTGKSALAAALAHRSEASIHWVDLYPGVEGQASTLIYQIARPLVELNPPAWHRLDALMLQRARAYPPMVLLQITLDAYREAGAPLLLVLDGTDEGLEPGAQAAIIALCDAVARRGAGRIRVLVAGRRLPYRLQLYALSPLGGLSITGAQAWASTLGLALDASQAGALIAQTGGLPGLLGPALREMAGFEGPFARPDAPLWEQIGGLTPDERELLVALARGSEPSPLPFERRALLARLEDLDFVARSPARGIVVSPPIRAFMLREEPA